MYEYGGQVCIGCMSTESLGELNSINTDKNLARVLWSCFNIKIPLDSQRNMCSSCIEILKQCIQFKKQILTSLSILVSQLVNTKKASMIDNVENDEQLFNYYQNEIQNNESNLQELFKHRVQLTRHQVYLKIEPEMEETRKVASVGTEIIKVIKARSDFELEEKSLIGSQEIFTTLQIPFQNASEIAGQTYTCNGCGQMFHRKIDADTHSCVHVTEKPFTCNLNQEMQDHIKEALFQCNLCDQQFTELGQLDQHLSKHEKPYQCTVCKKQFNLKSSLKRHLRTHSGEKPNQCNVCDKQFVEKSALRRHMRTHSGERPYHCVVCNKRFIERSSLLRHNMRTHIKEKPYECNLCDKQFIEKGCLQRHMRIHTGEKPHRCIVCEKQFVERSALMRHMRTHTGEKPHQCIFCSKKFSSACDLNRHLRSHTGEKPHQCSVCSKRFAVMCDLSKHMRTHAVQT